MAMSVNDWQGATTRGTTSEEEWHRAKKSDNELQWVTASESSGTVNENGTVHFKEWMIVIISMTKKRYTTTSRDGWLQLEWLNK